MWDALGQCPALAKHSAAGQLLFGGLSSRITSWSNKDPGVNHEFQDAEVPGRRQRRARARLVMGGSFGGQCRCCYVSPKSTCRSPNPQHLRTTAFS